MPRVPAHLLECVLGMPQGGMRTADVARAINCHVCTVRRLRQRYRETGWTADRPRSGRPRVTPAEDQYSQNLTPAGQVQDGNHCPSYTRNALSLQCSDSPAYCGQRVCRPVVRQVLTSNNGAYGPQTHLSLDQAGLAKIALLTSRGFVSPGLMVRFVFIFEGMSVTPRPVLWSGIDLEVEGLSWSGGGGGGGGSQHRRTEQVVIADSLNAMCYREDILLPHVVPFLQAHPDMTLQHDNTTNHTAHSVRDFLKDRNVSVLPWPAKSLDLNPIEHIWNLLDQRVRAKYTPPRNVQEHAGALLEDWGNISQQVLANLVQSMRRRCTAVLNAAGGHTRY
uniref:Tc1-like transposase DDE domain-containing protein n=1 Tax=Oncorhynchus mykiss TaxID=8022 RepID=A0A8K9UQ62_ONCMY